MVLAMAMQLAIKLAIRQLEAKPFMVGAERAMAKQELNRNCPMHHWPNHLSLLPPTWQLPAELEQLSWCS